MQDLQQIFGLLQSCFMLSWMAAFLLEVKQIRSSIKESKEARLSFIIRAWQIRLSKYFPGCWTQMQTIDPVLMIFFKMNGFKSIHRVKQLRSKLRKIKQNLLRIRGDNSKQRSWGKYQSRKSRTIPYVWMDSNKRRAIHSKFRYLDLEP